MTLYFNDPSELELANGTAATVVNTGGDAGNALTPVTSGGGTIQYQSGKWRHNHVGGVARFDLDVTAAGMLSVEVLFALAGTPAAPSRILEIRHAGGFAAHLAQGSDGKLYLADFAGTNVFTTAAAVPSPFRVHVGIQKGTTSSNGKIRFDVYTGSSGLSTTPAESFSSDAANAGTADLTTVRFGRVNTLTSSATIDLVNLQVSDAQITSLGPFVSPPNAVASAPGTVVVDARASAAGGGGTLTYSISPSAGTSQPVAGLFLVPSPSGSTLYTVTVTESPSGMTDTAQVTVEPATGTSGVRLLVFNGTSFV